MTPEPGREALAAIVAGYRRRFPQYAFEHYEFEQPGYENPSIADWEPLYSAAQLAKVEKERDEAREQMEIMRTQHALEITDMADNFRAVNVERVLALMPADVPALLARATTAETRAEAAEADLKASRERVAVLEEALKPFAEAADYFSNGIHRSIAEDALPCGPALIVSHLRRARNALKRETQNADQ